MRYSGGKVELKAARPNPGYQGTKKMQQPSHRWTAISLLALLLSAALHSANAAPVDFGEPLFRIVPG